MRKIPVWFVCLAIVAFFTGFIFSFSADAQTRSAISSPCAQSSAGREQVAPGNDATAASDENKPDISAAGCDPAQMVADAASPVQASLDDPQNSGGATIPHELSPEAEPVSDQRGMWDGERWAPAILQAFGFTVGQHLFRIATEQKTRANLNGPFWEKYWESVNGLHTWSDGGKFFTNYVAHPAQGAVFGDIWVEHDPHGSLVQFGQSRAYWISRLKAFWWVAAWELQWKLGPVSEASIGNVGLKPGTLGAEDEVNTPFLGTGLSIGEDAADRYIIAKLEKKTQSRALRGLMRTFFNPDRSLANVIRGKHPWYRDTRPGLRDVDP